MVRQMPKSYSYDPAKIQQNGLDRMRFELGDTTFDPGELTAALCDEEYMAILNMNDIWKKAKVEALKAILVRFRHQVDVSIDGLSYSFTQRVQTWETMLKEEKASLNPPVPIVNKSAIYGREGGQPYFHKDMQANLRKG